MTFSLADGGTFPDKLGHWPLPPEPLFVGSDNYDKLARDLRRYVNGEVMGRSYLVAGHRGAGKTALVIRAVQDLRTSTLRESVKEKPTLPKQVEGLQRPLIIKLHGPSLLCGPDPPTAAPSAETGQDVATPAPPDQAKPAPTNPDRPAPIESGAHAALVQITIGLYRALATEAALGFDVHARTLAGAGRNDLPERSAQLSLDLDSGPDPGSLRRYWNAIGRLPLGVFWPPGSDDTLRALNLHDQGMHEVIAIATAAQAFQVCTGRVSYDWKVKDKAATSAETTTKGSTDSKDVIGRVSTLGVGALTGVTLVGTQSATSVAAIGAGIAVWAIGNLSLNWEVKRTRSNEKEINYTFIRDREVTTLDRDLPVVIKRVREAGLAPVFVVDELDKVSNAYVKISELINQLKHLVSDFGFFCFLVNRDLFDQIEQRVEDLAYPVDHTHFGQRLLVRAEPHRLMVYLAQILKEEPKSATGDFARAVFALTVMHRAKFNLTDLTRAVADVAGVGDTLRMSEAELTAPKQLFIATVQIAISEILCRPALADRMREDPSYAQLVVDTLYYPSRCWERGEWEVPASRPDLSAFLRRRMGLADDDDDAREEGPTELDLSLLHGLLVDLLKDLSDFSGLKNKLGERLAFDDRVVAGLTPEMVEGLPRSVQLRDIIPVTDTGDSLMAAPSGGSERHRFVYDHQAAKQRARIRPWPARQMTNDGNLVRMIKAFESVLEIAHVTLDQLNEANLLPAIATQAELMAARSSVEAAIEAGSLSTEAINGLDRMRRLVVALRERGATVGPALLLAASVRRDASDKDNTLARISRLVDFTAPLSSWLSQSSPADHHLGTTPAGMEKWRDSMNKWLMVPAEPSTAPEADRYLAFNDRVPRYFDTGEASLGPFRYAELVLAADDEAPYRYLRPNPANMNARDWSGLALEAMPAGGKPAKAPYWVLIAALRALGFGQPLLGQLADPELTDDLASQGWMISPPGWTSDECMARARFMADGAESASPGVLLIRGDADLATGAQPPSRRRPTLVVGESDSIAYMMPIRWLHALGAFAGLVEGTH